MKRLILATWAVGAALLCGGAAQPDVSRPDISAAFKGTIISTYDDGRQGKLWLSEDGRYKAEGRRHDPSSGHWKLKGAKICLHQSSPPTFPISYCTAVPTGKAGSSWAAKSVMGDPIQVKLIADGRSGA